MYHDFWLFEEGVRSYVDHSDLLPRKDAPVRIDDGLLRYFVDTLSWIPTCNPMKIEVPCHGLNLYGPTIINQTGGDAFHRVCLSWVQLFASGPEHLSLRGPFMWQWPFDEEEHVLRENQLHLLGHYERLEVDRDWLLQALTTLADFGKQAATGKFFILHLGI